MKIVLIRRRKTLLLKININAIDVDIPSERQALQFDGTKISKFLNKKKRKRKGCNKRKINFSSTNVITLINKNKKRKVGGKKKKIK